MIKYIKNIISFYKRLGHIVIPFSNIKRSFNLYSLIGSKYPGQTIEFGDFIVLNDPSEEIEARELCINHADISSKNLSFIGLEKIGDTNIIIKGFKNTEDPLDRINSVGWKILTKIII
jgi:hypothetical protein